MLIGEGPIPVLARRRRRRFQRRVTVGVFSQGGGGEKLSGPGAILLLLLKGEYRRDKSRGGLAVCVERRLFGEHGQLAPRDQVGRRAFSSCKAYGV